MTEIRRFRNLGKMITEDGATFRYREDLWVLSTEHGEALAAERAKRGEPTAAQKKELASLTRERNEYRRQAEEWHARSAEAVRLRRERDQLSARVAELEQYRASVIPKIATHEAQVTRIETLLQALQRHGRHANLCRSNHAPVSQAAEACTCGLAALRGDLRSPPARECRHMAHIEFGPRACPECSPHMSTPGA
jgi:cell division protein FtsB